jgi:hypothetical protein
MPAIIDNVTLYLLVIILNSSLFLSNKYDRPNYGQLTVLRVIVPEFPALPEGLAQVGEDPK